LRPTTSFLALIVGALALIFGLGLTRPAAAQGGANKAAAEALFQQGRTLLEQQKYDQACDKLDASQQLEPAVGTLLFLGECNEKLGKKASAWAAFLEARSLAERQGDNERQNIAAVRAAALEPQVSKLLIHVTAPAEGLKLRRDGVELPAASWGTALPIDAGSHQLEATAPGKEPWTKNVTVQDGGATMSVDVPALRDRSAAPTEPAMPPEPTEPVAPGGGETELRSEGASAMQIAGIITLGVGVVGLGVGTAFAVVASSSNDESLDHCRTETLCSPTGLELRDDAKSEAAISTIFFAAGGVLAAAGLTIFLLAPSEHSSSEVAIGPLLMPGRAGLTLGGQW